MKTSIYAFLLILCSLQADAQSTSNKNAEREKLKKNSHDNATIPMQDLYLEQQQMLLKKLTMEQYVVVSLNKGQIRHTKIYANVPFELILDSVHKTRRENAILCKTSADSIAQIKKELLLLKIDITKYFDGKSWPTRITEKWKFNEEQVIKAQNEERDKGNQDEVNAYVDYCLA